MRFGPFHGAWCSAALVLGVFLGLTPIAFPNDAEKQLPSAAIGLFEAQAAGQLGVKLIPHDSTAGTVILTNRTAAPLTINLPAAFAALPVLAQFGGGRGAGFGANSGASGGGTQVLGGSINGGGNRLGNVGGGPFSIPPDRVVKLKFAAVCLEHGKPEPTPRVAYDLVPIEDVTSDDKVVELVEMLGRGQINQRAAQAAAWHFANGKTWQQLANIIGVRHISGATEPYFSSNDLSKARRAAEEVGRRSAGQGIESTSPGEVAGPE
jgi:hypothetical protein